MVCNPLAPLITNMLHAVLYTRRGCHLCDEAKALLVERGFQVQEVDIDQHPELRARYDTCVPVVQIEGKERFRGRIHPLLLDRLIQGLKRQSSGD